VLADETETSYQVGEFYSPPNERALRYDDPRLGLEWPLEVTVISGKDRDAPLLETWEERLRDEMTLPVPVAR
jgi:dTDP-4-dehydrorhamnose 3,5-epimerase